MCTHEGCSKAFSNSSDRAKHQRTHVDSVSWWEEVNYFTLLQQPSQFKLTFYSPFTLKLWVSVDLQYTCIECSKSFAVSFNIYSLSTFISLFRNHTPVTFRDVGRNILTQVHCGSTASITAQNILPSQLREGYISIFTSLPPILFFFRLLRHFFSCHFVTLLITPFFVNRRGETFHQIISYPWHIWNRSHLKKIHPSLVHSRWIQSI